MGGVCRVLVGAWVSIGAVVNHDCVLVSSENNIGVGDAGPSRVIKMRSDGGC